MARKKNKTSRGTLFARLLLASAILLFIPHENTKHLNYWFYELLKPVLTFAKGKSPEIFKPMLSEEDYVLRSKHEMLEKEYANALLSTEKLLQEYQELAGIHKNLPNNTMGIVLADVISVSLSGRNELVIDKGSLDGLKKGQYVLNREANCVIGTISDFSESIATVKLVTDAKHNMPAVVWRQGAKSSKGALLIGNGDDTAKIPQVSKDYDILPDDRVYANKKPGFLDAAILIGTIRQVSQDKNQPMLLDITVETQDDLTKIKSVVVLAIDAKMKYKDLK